MAPYISDTSSSLTDSHHDAPQPSSHNLRVHTTRTSASTGSIELLLRYADQFFEATLDKSSAKGDVYDTAAALTPETLIRLVGFRKEQSAKAPTKLINISEITVVSRAKPGLTNSLLSHGAPNEAVNDSEAMTADALQQRFDNRILDARVTASAAVSKLFSVFYELSVEYLSSKDFWRIHTPAFIGWEFPGDEHEQFAVNYFDRETAWLSQTGDVHLEMALAADFERVYDVHTVFRREEQVSARHMTEFTTLEIMWAFERDWTEIMEFSETFIKFLVHSIQNRPRNSKLVTEVRRLYPHAGDFKLGLDAKGRILRLKFSDAKKILRDVFGLSSSDDVDVTKQEEAILGKYLASEESTYGPPTDIFFLTHFPRNVRPYNVYASRDDPVTTHSVDIIMRGQEISTGYQCIHDYEELRHAMTTRKHPIDPDSTAWKPFVEAHDVGMPPLGGVAIGLNRLLQGFLGAADIRETALFPRDASRLRP